MSGSETVSKGAFAIMLGRMPSAVSNWIARGKIWGPAITADGKIVVDEALRQLGLTIDPGRGRPDLAKPPIPAPPPAPDEDPDTLAQVRLAREKLALEAQQRAAAIERGELVRAEEVSRLWASELGDLILAVEQWAVDLPAKLGLGRDAVDLVRREFREFRARRAEQAAAATAAEDDRAA